MLAETLISITLLFNLSPKCLEVRTMPHLSKDEEIQELLPCAEDLYNDVDYLSVMIDACVNGDKDLGLEAEQLRNHKIEVNELEEVKVSWEDLNLLSKVIMQEAGSYWLSDDHQLLVGNVVLNRVDSSEFPDTLYDVVYQEGQYPYAGTEEFDELLPSYRCVVNASLLLQGKRYCPDSVVFQANFEQGSKVYKIIEDIVFRDTYFCYSNYPELYEN